MHQSSDIKPAGQHDRQQDCIAISLFKALDKDENGSLSPEEFQVLFDVLGAGLAINTDGLL